MKNEDLNYQYDELAMQQAQDDLVWLMSHKQGRRIVWRQLEQTGVYRLSYHENPLHTAFKEGVRNEGLRLLNDVMRYCQEQYLIMIRENGEADGTRNTRDSEFAQY